MVPVILLLLKEFKIYVLKRTKIDIFPIIFLNVDRSFNISDRLLKFSLVIIGYTMKTKQTKFEIFICNGY